MRIAAPCTLPERANVVRIMQQIQIKKEKTKIKICIHV